MAAAGGEAVPDGSAGQALITAPTMEALTHTSRRDVTSQQQLESWAVHGCWRQHGSLKQRWRPAECSRDGLVQSASSTATTMGLPHASEPPRTRI